MPVSVSIKWGKKKIEDLVLDEKADVATFMDAVYRKTGVPVLRQKLLARKCWKGKLNDSMKFAEMKGIKDGMKITLIGTSEGIPKPPPSAVKVLFEEDMTGKDAAETGMILRPGLKNLGNTCYLNSTIQCLKAVPELSLALNGLGSGDTNFSAASHLSASLRRLFDNLSSSKDAVVPIDFVGLLRQAFPDPFAQRTATNFKQQDADEFYTTVMTKILAPALTKPAPPLLPSLGGAKNLIDALFGVRLSVEMKCQEVDKEPVKTKIEHMHKLVCNIRGTEIKGAEKVDHLFQGVLTGFEGSVEMNSAIAGRNCLWKKTARIDRLPRYLCVQFMRFFWKPTPNSRDHQGISCKIMRKVKFPKNLDVFDFCSKRLQAILRVPREKYAKKIMEEAERKSRAQREQTKLEKEGKASKTKKIKLDDADADGASKMDVVEEDEEDAAALRAALEMSVDDGASKTSGETAGIGIPSTFRGNYEIFAIVTHKGRSSSGGHYMGYVRTEGDNWLNFDDDIVEACKWEHIEPLAGGGDRDMAYIVFYRMKE